MQPAVDNFSYDTKNKKTVVKNAPVAIPDTTLHKKEEKRRNPRVKTPIPVYTEKLSPGRRALLARSILAGEVNALDVAPAPGAAASRARAGARDVRLERLGLVRRDVNLLEEAGLALAGHVELCHARPPAAAATAPRVGAVQRRLLVAAGGGGGGGALRLWLRLGRRRCEYVTAGVSAG